MKLTLFAAVLALSLFILNSSVNAQVEKKFKLTNKTGVALVSVRLGLHDQFNWGMDLNTMGKLPINGNIEFRQKIDSNLCGYDIKFDDGTKEYILQNVDFCKQVNIDIIMPPEEKIEPQK